ncbi:MAG TPA: hypothetical protein VJO54_15140 [Burkholderiales bacterium]|nr:hypothetical protein [Burkholderiales bacterium]
MPTAEIRGVDLRYWSGHARLILGTVLHEFPVRDRDVPLIPFEEWALYEEEIARAFTEFMKKADLALPSALRS